MSLEIRVCVGVSVSGNGDFLFTGRKNNSNVFFAWIFGGGFQGLYLREKTHMFFKWLFPVVFGLPRWPVISLDILKVNKEKQ